MKKIGKTILILLLIVFLFLLGLFIVRAKRSKELKSGLLREDSNGIIQQVVWGGNDLSINVNGPQTVLRIPISSVVPETLTRESFKFELNLYDENGNKLDYIIDGIERGEGGGVTSGIVIPFFKDSILGMKEFKMPVGAISRINEDTFQVELEDFDGYADMAGDDIWYKIFGKGKIDSVYLEIFHGNNVKLEFAIINEILDEPVVGEDYIPVEERTKALKENPWDWANNEDVYPTAWLQTLDTAVGVYPYASFFTSAFNSKDDVFILSFEIYSDDKEIKRFAIYDMDHHKRLFDCFDGGSGGYIQVDESIDIDSIDVMSCKEKYDEVIKNLSLTIDIKPEILTIPDGIPSLEQLEDVVAVCHNNTPNCVIDCDDWNITRKSYIIPYKDGYIGYNYGGNGEGRGYGLTYKTFDNPCETIATTDEIFFWHSHYKYNKETFGYDEYPDNKVYINRGLRGGSPTDEVAKVLDCIAGKDMMEDDTCKREVDKYMYNLIVGNEKNEYFTKWMNKFKEDLDNNKFTTTKFWIERHEECYERYKFEDLLQKDGKINSQLTDDERKYYIKLQNDNLHECAMEYLNK